jgi:hypothetical protein
MHTHVNDGHGPTVTTKKPPARARRQFFGTAQEGNIWLKISALFAFSEGTEVNPGHPPAASQVRRRDHHINMHTHITSQENLAALTRDGLRPKLQ